MAGTYDVNDSVKLGNPAAAGGAAAFTDGVGIVRDPQSATLLVTSPSGLAFSYTWPTPATLTRESLGRFYASVVLSEAGVWTYTLTGTSIGAGDTLVPSASATGTVRVGGGATLLRDAIALAAGHPFLGGMRAFRRVTPSGTGTPTTVVSTRLTDSSGRATYTDWWLYCYESAGGAPLTGESRLVQSVTLASGTLTVNRPYARATEAGDRFWLLRTIDRDRWAELACLALKQMKRRLTFTVPSAARSLRYPLPAALARAEEVIDVGTRRYPLVATDGMPEPVPWFGVEDRGGALELVLRRDVPTDRALVYYGLKPFADPGEDALVADDDATTAPADWLVAEMVALALVERMANAASPEDRQSLQWALAGAGRLVAGFRRKYESQGERRVMAPDPSF